ncbi:MAG: hypothetical protein P8080_11135 [Gammaproteobacteria bacterium]
MAEDIDRHEAVERLAEQIERSRLARLRQVDESGLRPECAILADWQSRRLRHTYSDLLASERYRPAVEFFLSDLYGARDFSARDEGVERVYPLISRVLPGKAVHTISKGIELHALSQELDLDMVAVLWGELGVTDRLDADVYAEAWRRCHNEPQRRRQIALVAEVGHSLDDVVFKPMIYNAVRMARTPARVAGLSELHDFIERGFVAFRKMRGSGVFLDAIFTRENQILDAILAGEPTDSWAPPDDSSESA